MFFLSIGEFLQSSAQPHESAARPLQRAVGHIKRTRPIVDSGDAMEKCKQANKFQSRHYGYLAD